MTVELADSLHDPDRLAALRRTSLLDTPAEEAFDRLTHLTARLLRTPIALVSLVDEDRQFFKSSVGLPEPWASRRETPLSHSFCRHAVASGEPLVVVDARENPLLRDSPAVSELGVVAYAGVPLLTSDGHALGTLCAIDTQPRVWSDEDLATLKDLAASVMTEVELHLTKLGVGLVTVPEADPDGHAQAERELRERMRQASLAADVGVALTGANFLSTKLQRCAEAIVRHLDVAFARIWTLNAAEQVLELKASAGLYTHLNGPHSRVPVGAFKIGKIAQEREPHLTNNVVGDPRVNDQDWARREGMVAFAGYPLIVEDRLVGVMAMFARQPLSESTLTTLAAIADAISLGIDQAQAEEVRRESLAREQEARAKAELAEVRYRDLVNGLDAIVWEADPGTFQFTFVSERAEAILGYPVRRWLDEPDFWANLIHPDDRAWAVSFCARATAEGRDHEFEYRVIAADGSVLWLHDRVYVTTDATGKPQHLRGVMVDITARRQAEEVLRQATAHARCLLWHAVVEEADLDGNWKIEMIDPDAAQRVLPLNVGPGQSYADAWRESKSPEDRVQMHRNSVAALRSGQSDYDQEFRCRRADGEVRWLAENAHVERLGPGRWWVVGVCTDITERKQLEEARDRALAQVEAERARLHSLFMQAPAIICVMHGPDHTFEFVNPRYLQIVGNRNPVGKSVREALPELKGQGYFELLDRVYATGESQYGRETRALIDRHGDGTLQEAFFNFVYQPTRDLDGEVDGIMVHAVEVTEQVMARREVEAKTEEISRLNSELERRVAERTAELTAAVKELESFSYSVSHDLRAPLRTIDGFSLALLEDFGDRLDGSGKDYLHRIRSASQRMAQLIDDLLGLSRVARAEMRREPVDLSALAHAIADGLRRDRPDREVIVDIAPGLVANGDARLLRIVLENLLDNAWKFTARSNPARVEFGATERNDERIYFVRDNGAGFDMAYAAKLFGPFQRLHSTTEFDGNGIGLATVQRIVRRHGGRIWAEAAVDQGATFYFTLG